MAIAGSNRKPALTAAASKISYSRASGQKLKELPWQDRAWQVYEAEGSIYFMTRYRSAVARKIDYYAAVIEEPGDDPDIDATVNSEGEFTGPGAASKVLEAEGGPELIRRLVSELMVHWDVSGEAYLTRFDAEPFWRILSTQELKKQGDATQFSWGDDTFQQGTIEADQVYRVWKPHPRFHWQADSPTKHVLEDAEELILLRRELKARSQSRLPAGAWVLPDTVDFSPFGQDEAGTEDDFARELTTQMTQAVSDPGSAAAQVPWVLTVSPQDHPLVVGGFINFHRDWEVPMEQREALLRAIATGLDVPPEILTGMADLNHWSAWLVSEQAVSQHVAPTVDDILDSLTTNWFRPLLAAASVDPDRYVLWRDLSPATVAPDRSDTALAMFKEGVISDIAVRRVSDFDEEDAPEEAVDGAAVMDADELIKRINALGVLRRAGATWESANQAVGLPPIELIPGLLPITLKAEEVVQNEAPVVAAPLARDGIQAAIDPDLLSQIVEAVAERLGGPPLDSAAVTAATRRRIVATELADIDQELLAWLVDETQTEIDRLLGIVEKSLTAATDPLDESLLSRFRARVEKRIAQAQQAARQWVERLTGRPTEFADEMQTRSAGLDMIVGGVLEAIRRRLFTPSARPDPIDTGRLPDTLPPTDVLRRGLSVAGGGAPRFDDVATVDMIGNGQRIHDELERNGFRQQLWVWRYGHPKHSFEPHLRLSGQEFDSWESPKLAVGIDGAWIGRSFYEPGDHRGCQCMVEQVLAELSTVSPETLGQPAEPAPVMDLPNYVNPRTDRFTLNTAKAVNDMTPAQINTVQEAFRRFDRRWPGALDELQEVYVSPDTTAFATKSRWQVIYNQEHIRNVTPIREGWAEMHGGVVEGKVSLKAGGAADNLTYVHNVSLHEMGHIAENRYRAIATPEQTNRLYDQFTKMQADHSINSTLENPFETLPSLYADENYGEFVAECLADVMIGESPNITSLRVAELFDEVFK